MYNLRCVNVRKIPKDKRAHVCYVGRGFAGWPASPWGNPFPVGGYGGWSRERCLKAFRNHAESQPESWLANLWVACEQGAKPLGCWCIDAKHGDKQEVVCHAQILMEMLAERYLVQES